MGRQIVYCDQCGKLLKEQDFDQRRAHVVENRSFCIECRPLAPEPPPAKKLSSSHAIPIPSKGTTSRSLPKISPGSSTRFNPVETAPPPKSKAPLLVGAGVGALAVVVALVYLLSGGNRAEERQAVVAPDAPGTGFVPPPPVPPPAAASPLEEAAKRAYGDAIEFQRRNGKDLGGQIDRFMKISEAYKGTSVAEVAVAEAAKVRLALKEQIFALDQQVQALTRAGEFGKALDLVEQSKGRYAAAEWTSSTQEIATRLRTEAGRLYGTYKANAVQCKRRSDADQVKHWSDKVARMNIPEYVTDLTRELAAVVPDAPEPPKPVTTPPAVEAYRSGWMAALTLAASHDGAGAVAALEKVAGDESVKAEREADLALLKGLQAFYAEAPALLAKTPKGQKIAIEYWDASGAAAKVEEAVARIDAHRIEVKPVTVSYGEVRARTLAAAWLARPGKKPEDAKVAALACLLERDLEGAAGLEPRFPAWAAAPPSTDPKEGEARKLFYAAEQGWFDPARMQQAADAYRMLLADFAGTAFVRRNHGAITGRTELPKEFFFLHDDLAVAGGFKQGKSKKVEVCWTSEKDLDDAARKSNFVEFSFPAAAGPPYRCWAYVGGCCQETFAFFAQGTEFTGPDPKNPRQSVPAEPGGEGEMPLKPYVSGVKKLHEQHLGPKEPDRWEWVQIPLPKYASAGTKVVRLLTDQKGFSVAHVVVSAARAGAPPDREIAVEEKRRAETPGFASQGLPSMGVILREWWSGIGGTGMADLTKSPNFPDKPTGFDLVPAFDTPINWADEYGTRIRGYVLPPATGEYIFWITTDDHGELFLSTDDTPANKKKIASVPEWATAEEWEKNGAQKSAPIKLEAGKRYYIEALQKEGGGGDHLRVGWQLPDGKMERPIPGNRLAPCPPPRK